MDEKDQKILDAEQLAKVDGGIGSLLDYFDFITMDTDPTGQPIEWKTFWDVITDGIGN